MEIAFLINTTSKIAGEAFDLMKRSIKKFIETHGEKQDKYHVFVHGNEATLRKIFSSDVKENERGTAKFPALHEDLKTAGEMFFKNSAESAEKVGVHQYSGTWI